MLAETLTIDHTPLHCLLQNTVYLLDTITLLNKVYLSKKQLKILQDLFGNLFVLLLIHGQMHGTGVHSRDL